MIDRYVISKLKLKTSAANQNTSMKIWDYQVLSTNEQFDVSEIEHR